MKTLVIVIHPNLNSTSIVNKRWIEELKKYPEQFEVRNLYEVYPNEHIDVAEEQRLIEKHNRIIFQFPVYWNSCPPLFKKWMDEVLTYSWAYGSHSGYKFANKKVALALTLSGTEQEYSHLGIFKYTLEEFTRPFEITFDWINAEYKPFFAFFGVPHLADEKSLQKIEQSAIDYVSFAKAL